MTDISVARSGPARAAASVIAWLVASTGMMLALLAPALWNGFPLVFPDTGGYLTRPIEGTLAMGRSALYGWFLYSAVPLAFWPVVVAQAGATAWTIALTLRVNGFGGRPGLALAMTVLLSLVTSLPWFAAQLMPDIFFPLAALALCLLAFRSEQLGMAERVALAALIAAAIAAHMAALALCVGVLALVWPLSRWKALGLPRFRASYALAGIGGGFVLCLASNLVITGSFAFTPGGSSFLFGRLIEDGIVERYLNEHCPDPRWRICAYAQHMPASADDWLWANDTPFYRLGGAEGFGGEATQLVAETIKLYPVMHVKAALGATLDQFTSFQTEISIDDNDPIFDAIRDYAPQLMPAFQAARQQAQPFDVGPLNLVHVPAGALAIAGLIGALIARRSLKLSPALTALCVCVLAALLVNAAVCGVFSHAVDRYQSRLIVLAVFAATLLIAQRNEHPRLEEAPA